MVVPVESVADAPGVMVLRPRRSVYIGNWLVGGFVFVLGAGLLALVAVRGRWVSYIFPGLLGVGGTVSAISLLWASRPGANSLRLDPAGFTFRAKGREQRHEWHSVDRIVIARRVVGYNGAGSRPAGIEVTFRNQPFGEALRIGDPYTIRRHELLSIMSRYAGPDVPTTPKDVPAEDIKHEKKITRIIFFNTVIVASMIGIVIGILRIHQGVPVVDSILSGVVSGGMPIFVFALYYFLNSPPRKVR